VRELKHVYVCPGRDLNPKLFGLAILILCSLGGFPGPARACEQLPAGQTFRIRLLQPISSYSSKAGTIVRGFIIESPRCDGLLAFPMGTLVEGHIVYVQKVGMGFRHEVAEINIGFDRILQGDSSIEMQALVMGVDNAREKVKDGLIKGIRGTNTPQDHLSGMIPYLAMWHPGTYWILPVYKAAFPVFPEPEIFFPAGTDLLLGLVRSLPLTNVEGRTSENREFDALTKDDLEKKVLSLPVRTSTSKGGNADVVNLAFIGSREQVEDAFQAAGWLSTDPSSKRTVMRQLRGILMMHSYPTGPMSEQLLQDKPYDLSWQKSLDSVSKRDHLRIWSDPETWQGQSMWLSASTQDVSVHLVLFKGKITHLVDPQIDEERERIVRDLTLAGCVETVYNAPRPALPRSFENATGTKMLTDGAVAVVQLKNCGAPAFESAENDPTLPILVTRPPSKVARYFRTQVLSFRDLWRENAVYNSVQLSRMGISSLRRKLQDKQEASAAPPQIPLNPPTVTAQR
jgi:hypothetical protein